MGEPTQTKSVDDRKRDATSLTILGSFFSVLSLLVLLGTLWSLDDRRAIIVTLTCGVVLLAVGLGMIAIGRKTTRKN